ncbi:MAG: sugar porter family MFS transporter [Terrimicrobiaceae bacterium]|nr:sugar porter family MFS transporter [Terrimicrobiaceae bacterium]
MPTEHKINLPQVILVSCVAAIGGFLFGFDSGVINGTVEALQAAFKSSSVGSGFNVASMLLGCAGGAFLAGSLADKFGRRAVMIVTAIFFAVSAWGSGIAGSSAEFVFYRVLGGFAVGAASILCPAYISEVAPASMRGRLASLQQLAIVLGLFMAFLSNFAIAAAAHGASSGFWFGFQAWQWMFWMEMVPSTVFLLSLFFIPESPRYLVAAGRHEHARGVFQKLGCLAHEAEQQVKEVLETLEKGRKPRLADLRNKESGRIEPILWVGIGLATFQQLVGINVVFYYGAVLWQAAGFSEKDALLINVISGGVNIFSTLVAMSLVDRIGRKPLLIGGSAGMVFALGTMASVFGTSGTAPDGSLKLVGPEGTTSLIAANAYVFFFGVSWGPVMWVMLGEMFKNRFRGAALSISGFAQWMSNFAITMTFPILLSAFGLGGAYGLYTLCALLSIFFVLWFVRETKGKTLEEM